MVTRVERATPSDAREVGTVLAAAFATDPVFVALIPDARRRPDALRRFFGIEAGARALKLGHSWVAREGGQTTGASVVLPSGQRKNPAENNPRVIAAYLRTFGRHTLLAKSLSDVLECAHPTEPHLYLPFIGAVQPGHGAGSQLLAAIGADADHHGLPVYLEASSPTSARLYRRHGFVDQGEIRARGVPPLIPMWRAPAAKA